METADLGVTEFRLGVPLSTGLGDHSVQKLPCCCSLWRRLFFPGQQPVYAGHEHLAQQLKGVHACLHLVFRVEAQP